MNLPQRANEFTRPATAKSQRVYATRHGYIGAAPKPLSLGYCQPRSHQNDRLAGRMTRYSIPYSPVHSSARCGAARGGLAVSGRSSARDVDCRRGDGPPQHPNRILRCIGCWKLEIVKRTDAHRFVALPKRWIVERTFAWISRNRRLARVFERYARTVVAFVRLAMIRIMLTRLTPPTPCR